MIYVGANDGMLHAFNADPNDSNVGQEMLAYVPSPVYRTCPNGLEPNFGCCTANFHQGWPKFVESMWMAPAGGGLAAMAYGPSEVRTTVDQVPVSVSEETNYPFSESVKLRVNPDRPVPFPLMLRIPVWADPIGIAVDGFKQRGIVPGTFFKIEREWKPGDAVDITFVTTVRIDRGFNRSASVMYGPLVFSLKIGEKWKKLADKGQTADWSVEPKTPWNYALLLDGRKAGVGLSVEIHRMGDNPFTADGTPIVLRAMAKRVPTWKLVDGSAGPVPESPVDVGGGAEKIELIPFAAAKLRITAFPVAKK